MSTSDQPPVTPPETQAGSTGPGSSVVSGWHDQDGLLREMWIQNQTPQAIAEALGRSVPAVMTRAARLGLPRRAAPGRKPGGARAGVDGAGMTRVVERPAPRAKTPSSSGDVVSQTSVRVCLMCLKKFESAGRHNRICSTCKNSAEYGSASALPEIPMPHS